REKRVIGDRAERAGLDAFRRRAFPGKCEQRRLVHQRERLLEEVESFTALVQVRRGEEHDRPVDREVESRAGFVFRHWPKNVDVDAVRYPPDGEAREQWACLDE